jgi:hypothetical protein
MGLPHNNDWATALMLLYVAYVVGHATTESASKDAVVAGVRREGLHRSRRGPNDALGRDAELL